MPNSGAEMQMTDRVEALRARLGVLGVDGFVVPRGDEHQGEYVPANAERLAWLTGFNGSAGQAIVLATGAAIFTDGRYTLQVHDQVDTEIFTTRHVTDEPADDWIAEHLGQGGKLGYDPWLHTLDGVKRLRKAAEKAGGELVALKENPVDAIWSDRPPPPMEPVVPHPIEYSGEESADKRRRIAESLVSDGQDAVFLSAPDSIAWLLNIRGSDVPRTPFPLSFAILDKDGSVELFVDEAKLGAETRAHLGNSVMISPRDALAGALEKLATSGSRLRIDPATAPSWVFDRFEAEDGAIASAGDPITLPKACKNEAELAGTRTAHRRDAVAVSRFLHWLQATAENGSISEMMASDRFLAFRDQGALFRDLSFDTISGSGPNGAIVHYRVTDETSRMLGPGELYLVDSGAQYLDGTTDITRTVVIGEPSAEARENFTLVLKGHIALATAIFPEGTTGGQLDVLARAALWRAGRDYDHGTGHGVGSYLSVHEGPQRISKRGGDAALMPGMIISNEPGYYKAGAYGIRIENLLVVRPVEVPGGERPMLEFETITLAPIDRRLIDLALLDTGEIEWLDAYHARVRDALMSELSGEDLVWLEQATAPL